MTWTIAVSIIVPICTSIITLIGVVITSRTSHDKTVNEVKTEISLLKQEFHLTNDDIKKDIQSLEKKQDKHNGLIERMYCVEKSVELIDERQKVANKRIADLERLTTPKVG